MILVGVIYAAVGVVFAWPENHVRVWRLAAWLVSAAAFATHIGYESFRVRAVPSRAAWRAALAVLVRLRESRRDDRNRHLDASAHNSPGRSTMPRYVFIAAIVALAGTMIVGAQQKPDFSGEWQLNVHASVLSAAVAAVAQSGALRIEHREPSFACQMTIVLDGKPFETKYELLTDGREVTNTKGGRRTVSSLRWDGDALVMTTRVEIPSGEMTIAFRYERQDGGRRLRASEQLRGAGRDQDNTWVFERP